MGIQDKCEVDFVAERLEGRVVCAGLFRMETERREFAPLLRILDHHPKYVVSMDEVGRENMEGVRHVHIADFLLMDRW